jgi:uncharacterized protein (TIGR02611 family)
MKRLRRWRDQLRQRRTANAAYRAAVGVIGTIVLAAGILAIPYPGPGWAIVFVGLAILASEFDWAHRTLAFVKGRYDAFMGWFGRQALWVRAIGAGLTASVVVTTLWLVGALDLMAGWVGVEWRWLQSPLGIGS